MNRAGESYTSQQVGRPAGLIPRHLCDQHRHAAGVVDARKHEAAADEARASCLTATPRRPTAETVCAERENCSLGGGLGRVETTISRASEAGLGRLVIVYLRQFVLGSSGGNSRRCCGNRARLTTASEWAEGSSRSRAEGQVCQWHFGKRRPGGPDHEEQPPELVGLDAARSWRCRGASYPRSKASVTSSAPMPTMFRTFVDPPRQNCGTGSILLLVLSALLLSPFGVPLAAPALCPIEARQSSGILAL